MHRLPAYGGRCFYFKPENGFLDRIEILGKGRDRTTAGWPEGRSAGDRASQQRVFLADSKRSEERMPNAAQRVNAVNQLKGLTGIP